MQLLFESNLNSIHTGHIYQSNSTESLLAMSVETLLCKAAVNHMINRSPTLFTGQAFSLSLSVFFYPTFELSHEDGPDLVSHTIFYSVNGYEVSSTIIAIKESSQGKIRSAN